MINHFPAFFNVASQLMHTLMLQVNEVSYCNYILSIQLSQIMNGREEQENGEMDVTYGGNSNITSVILIRRNVTPDRGYNS